METTKLSTKGQIVIPENIRSGIEIGTSFTIIRQNDLIVLKKIKGLDKKEEKEVKELNKIWKNIDEGKGVTLQKEKFLKEMNAW
ncbi:MAG: AbrB/MazE/SpoVT family DNA-binding domain-containing protein [Nanoarchaeota archaeon]|nr:AbrB/MazE/SpoVT family DNA-binding domain-containing protein [Nanoarchaeota archaeon]